LINKNNNKGFTLIETMVSLIIVGLAMMAINTQMNRFFINSSYLEKKVLASWIASNSMAELTSSNTWPAIGVRTNEIEFSNRLWIIETEVSNSQIDQLRRIDISIYEIDNRDKSIHVLTSLIEPPIPLGVSEYSWLSNYCIAGSGPGCSTR